jgi:hypothetical protein
METKHGLELPDYSFTRPTSWWDCTKNTTFQREMPRIALDHAVSCMFCIDWMLTHGRKCTQNKNIVGFFKLIDVLQFFKVNVTWRHRPWISFHLLQTIFLSCSQYVMVFTRFQGRRHVRRINAIGLYFVALDQPFQNPETTCWLDNNCWAYFIWKSCNVSLMLGVLEWSLHFWIFSVWGYSTLYVPTSCARHLEVMMLTTITMMLPLNSTRWKQFRWNRAR